MKLLLSITLALAAAVASAQQLAFPGAEGFGAYASGARGGKVVHVTNLNAAGSGSLAEAVGTAGNFVVFDVGGVIDITGKNITIASNVTIAGQTAPGEGITIYGGRVIASKSKNVIIRYIRMRGGKSVDSSKCTLTLDNCENLIMDHCSVSWGPWDNVHIKDANNITWQYSIISEGIDPQRFGAITDGTRNWTVHHCLWSNNKSRNPKMKCYIQYYNNIVYNYQNGVVGGHSAADNYQDLMNNYFIAGPEGSGKYFDQWTETDHMYSSGNYFDGNCDGKLNGTLITDHNGATVMSGRSLSSTAPMKLETARAAYNTVVDHVGASRVRDSHDLRLIDELKSLGKKGKFIATEDDLGGIGTIANGTKPKDSDNDGMADEWERANGLNPNKDDANEYNFDNGYTNIENYVNSLAQKSPFLSAPSSPTATLTDPTTVKLTWVNNNTETVNEVVVEQSENGKKYTEIQRLAGNVKTYNVTGLTADKIYYFRMKFIGEDMESDYSIVVSVNDDYMKGGGGTAAGTTTFTPQEGVLYRIINYATIPYNSGTTLSGNPKYLTFNTDGSLGSTETFQWDNKALAWEIIPAEDGFYIRNYSSKRYIAPTNSNINSAEKIGWSTSPAVLTINYTGDQQPSQAGTAGKISMFRINSPSNSNQQIRARGFADDWFWGSGTLDRADMVFTFVAVDEMLIRLSLTKFNTTLDNASTLAKEAQTEVTMGYPTEALSELMDAINEARTFADNIDADTKQTDVDAAATALSNAITEFKATQIKIFTGFNTDMAYNIYSYGTAPNSSTSVAKSDVQRRYLYAMKGTEGESDQLVYRIGLSDDQINAGETDAYTADPAALWAFTEEGNGYVTAVNMATGSFLQIESTLSATPVTFYPYYANTDNGKPAFFMYADENGKRLFNVGAMDDDGLGGAVAFTTLHADRTRMRWVIEVTDQEADVTSVISPSMGSLTGKLKYYNLQGMELRQPPESGIYIERSADSSGKIITRKVFVNR